MNKLILWAALLVMVLPQKSFAGDEVINQFHFFYGQNFINPTDANTVADAASLGQFKKFDQYGIEADRDIGPNFNLGLRLAIKVSRTDPTFTTNNDYFGQLMQQTGTVMLNFPLIKSERFKLDAFTGFGANNTSLEYHSATYEGKYSSNTSFPTTVIGGAVAYGYKYVFLKIEGGYEYNKVGRFTKTSGTMTDTFDSMDLSGAYFNIGILIDGLALGKL